MIYDKITLTRNLPCGLLSCSTKTLSGASRSQGTCYNKGVAKSTVLKLAEQLLPVLDAWQESISSSTLIKEEEDLLKAFLKLKTHLNIVSPSTLRRNNRRNAWIAANGPCQMCGATSDLEADHIDWRTKEHSVGDIWHRNSEIRRLELAKCQVLCADCHQKKSGKEMSERRKGVKLTVPIESRPAEVWDLLCDGCGKTYKRQACYERFHRKRRTHGSYCTVKCRNLAMAIAKGQLIRTDPKHVADTAKVIELAKQGVAQVEIQKMLNLGRDRVKRVLDENNIASRKNKRNDPDYLVMIERIVILGKAGFTMKEIAKEVGCTINKVQSTFKEHNIHRRPQHDANTNS